MFKKSKDKRKKALDIISIQDDNTKQLLEIIKYVDWLSKKWLPIH